MSKTLELNLKINAAGDLKKIVSEIKGAGEEANKARGPVVSLESAVERLQRNFSPGRVSGVKEYFSNIGSAIGNFRSTVTQALSTSGLLHASLDKTKEHSEKAGRSFEGLSDKVIHHLENPMRSARLKVLELLEGMGRLPAIGAAAAVGLGVVITKAVELVKEFGEGSQATQNFALRLGITPNQAEQLQAAGKIVGVNAEALEGAARLISAALDEEANSGNKTQKALKNLGIDLREAGGEQKEMGKVVIEVLEKLSQYEDKTKRIKLAQDTLGRSSKVLAPLIEDYDRLLQVVRGLGVEFDEGDRQLIKTAQHIRELDVAWEEAKKGFAVKINPIVVPIVFAIRDLITGNENEGTTDADRQSRNIAKYLKGTLLPALAGPLSPLAQEFSFLNSFRKGEPKSPAVEEAKPAEDEQLKARLNAEADKFVAAFKASQDGMKKRLEAIRPEINTLVARLSGRDANRAEDQAQLDKLRNEEAGITASLKAAADRPALLKKLAEAQAAALEGALSPGVRALQDFRRKDEELLKELGPGFNSQIIELYSQQRADEVAKIIKENRKTIVKGLEDADKEASAGIHARTQIFVEELRKNIEQEKKNIEHAAQAIAVFDERDKSKLNAAFESDRSRLSRGAENDIRRGELTAKPGDEAATAERILQRRIQLAQELANLEISHARQLLTLEEQRDLALLNSNASVDEKNKSGIELLKTRAKVEEEIDKARAERGEKIDQAQEERDLKLLETRKQSLQKYHDSAERVFDALTSSGGGASLISGVIKQQERAIFANLSTSLFSSVGSTLGKLGAKSGLGSILTGTLFDPANADAPEKKLVTSQDKLRKSVDDLRVTISGGGLGVGGVGGDLGSIPGLREFGSDVDGIANFATTVTGKKPGGFLNFLKDLGGGGKSVLSGGLFSGLKPGDFTINDGPGKASSASSHGLTSVGSRIGNVAASAGAVAAGAFGVINGIQEGGARGFLGAAGSALGVASLIPGPQQPFLMAASVVVGAIRGLLGDPKKQREKRINEELQDAQKEGQRFNQAPINISIDSSGREVGHDFRGRLRTFNTTPRVDVVDRLTGFDTSHENDLFNGSPYGRPVVTPTRTVTSRPLEVHVHVSAIDSRSIIERSGAIGDALTKALKDGHRVGSDIQQRIAPR